jgi:hypothetical protein
MTVITGKENIDYITLCAFKGALKLEARGMHRRGKSALSIAKARGLTTQRTAVKALEEIQSLIDAHPSNPANQ